MTMQCCLPTNGDQKCSVSQTVDQNLTIGLDHGRFELQCTFYTSATLEADRRPWIGELTIDPDTDWAQVIALGQVQNNQGAIVISKYISRHPRTIRFDLIFSQQGFYSHPEEDDLLTETMWQIAEAMHRLKASTVPLTQIENRLRSLQLFGRVMGHYKSSFRLFLEQHPKGIKFHREPGLDPRLSLKEPLSSNDDGGEIISQESDDRGDIEDNAQEASLVQAMIALLERNDGPLEARDMMQQLEKVPQFQQVLRPSVSMVSRFLRLHRDVFYVRDDPSFTTIVGLVENRTTVVQAEAHSSGSSSQSSFEEVSAGKNCRLSSNDNDADA